MTTTIFFPRTWLLRHCKGWLSQHEYNLCYFETKIEEQYAAVINLGDCQTCNEGDMILDLPNNFINNYFNKGQ